MLILSFVFAFAVGERPPDCKGPWTRSAVVQCARTHSPRHRADLEHVAAARGEENAARVLLPSNPELSVSFAERVNGVGDTAFNVYGTVSQELEIAGQRRKRRDAARARTEASQRRADVTEREVVAAALAAYYEVLARQREVDAIAETLSTAESLETLAHERAVAGVGAPVDEDLAAAESARVREEVVLAKGRLRAAKAELASVMGANPAGPYPRVAGALAPLPVPKQTLAGLGDDAADGRPEVEEARATRRAEAANLLLLKRSRAPNPRLSFFVQRDGLDERVIGAGLAFPLPLPAPLGHTNKGQIEASRAKIREYEQREAATRRHVRLETAVAYHEYQAWGEAAAIYSPESDERTRQTLADLAAQIEAGRLLVRDALLTQRTLQDRLLRRIEAEHMLCLASIRLVLAAGLPFEGSDR